MSTPIPEPSGEISPLIPVTPDESRPVIEEKPARGGCLSAWLILIMVLAVLQLFSLGFLFFVQKYAVGLFEGADLSGAINLALTRAAIYTVLFIAALAMWRWRKWGFYLFVVFQLLMMFRSILNNPDDIQGLILIVTAIMFVVFYILVRRRWRYFR